MVEALQGPIYTPPREADPGQNFTGRAQQAVQQVVEKAQSRVRAVFEEITLADLAAAGFSAPAENRL